MYMIEKSNNKITNKVIHNIKANNRSILLLTRMISDDFLSLSFRQGLSGRACVLRALCEARQILGRGGGMMEDIFHTLFTQVFNTCNKKM